MRPRNDSRARPKKSGPSSRNAIWSTNVRGAMPIPRYEGRRTYFFFADVEPRELMTFGVESGIPLDDDSTLEVLGHALAYWAIAEEQEVLTLRAFVQDVFDVTLAIYALIRLDRGDRRDALRLRAELHSWLEVRGVEARANVVGTIHERYEAGAVSELDGPRARDFTTAATAAWGFVREPTLRLAFKDFGFSLRDRGDDAFLYAYRAVENARRFHAAKVSATETTPVWPPLHAALGTSEGQLQPLTDAATSIRHGDTKSAALAAARVNRDATLVLAEVVLQRLAQHEGVSW
jgi:hypothetical protein